MTSREKRRKEFRKAISAHRAEIEYRLNRGVDQPPCGCEAKWQWIWAGPDWIVPESVSVLTYACKDHDGKKLEEDFTALLKQRMATVRNENEVPHA